MDDPFTTSARLQTERARYDRQELNLSDRLPPIVQALYQSTCTGCGDWISEGDRIQSDDAGGWLGECCLEEK